MRPPTRLPDRWQGGRFLRPGTVPERAFLGSQLPALRQLAAVPDQALPRVRKDGKGSLMGINVYGKRPSGSDGVEFQRPYYRWCAIPDYINARFPFLAMKVQSWTDGDGLEAEDSAELSARIDADIATGRAAEYVRKRDEANAALPPVECVWCKGRGVRCDHVGEGHGMMRRGISRSATSFDGETPHPRAGQIGWCNACDGHGYNPHPETSYPLTVEMLRAFARFLSESGGFECR